MRSLLSILLIGVPVTLILCLVGLSHGFIEDSQKRQRGVGADILVRPKSSSFLSLNGAPIPQQLVGYLARQPHVKWPPGSTASRSKALRSSPPASTTRNSRRCAAASSFTRAEHSSGPTT